jgi:excisionase family DNA binding protein
VDVEDFYTTGEAARILRVTESRVRQLLADEELKGTRDVNKRWQIPQHAVHARLDRRGPREPRASTGPDVSELIDRIARLEHDLGRAEMQIELTEQTHSSVQEDLRRERERSERLESELSELRSRGFWARLFGG